MKKIFNWKQFNESYEEPMDASSDKYTNLNPLPASSFESDDLCDKCEQHHTECACEVDEFCPECANDTENCVCDEAEYLNQEEEYPTHDDSRFPYDNENDFAIGEKMNPKFAAYLANKKAGKTDDKKTDDKKTDKKLSPKQKKIASAAEPKDKIDGKDFAALRKKKK